MRKIFMIIVLLSFAGCNQDEEIQKDKIAYAKMVELISPTKTFDKTKLQSLSDAITIRLHKATKERTVYLVAFQGIEYYYVTVYNNDNSILSVWSN